MIDYDRGGNDRATFGLIFQGPKKMIRVALQVAILTVSISVAAKGPNGLGPVKIGISKSEIEALSEKDGVYLASPMTPFVSKSYTPVPGVEIFNSILNNPIGTTPLKVALTFTHDKLTGLSIDLTESEAIFDTFKKQMLEKYGSGKIDDDRKEEQCVYKNGSNFKITSGAIRESWIEPIDGSTRIETRATDLLLQTCPINLGGLSLPAVRIRNIQMAKKLGDPPKLPNLF